MSIIFFYLMKFVLAENILSFLSYFFLNNVLIEINRLIYLYLKSICIKKYYIKSFYINLI